MPSRSDAARPPRQPRHERPDAPSTTEEHARVPVGVGTAEHAALPVAPRPHPAAEHRPEPPRRQPSPAGLLEMNPTTETVERLWDEGAVTPLEAWQPAEFAEAPRLNTSAFVTAGLIVFAVFALWTAASELIARQDARLEGLHGDTVALADIVESAATGNADERLADIDTYARAVFTRADDLDLGNPDRALAIEAAGTALDLERALGDAFAYRAALEAVMERPALPTAGEPEQASAAAERLVLWTTGVTEVLSAAPELEGFSEHRNVAAEFTTAVEALQTGYLDALRAGDTEAATQALIELDTSVKALEATIEPAVEAVVARAADTAGEIRQAAARMSAVQED